MATLPGNVCDRSAELTLKRERLEKLLRARMAADGRAGHGLPADETEAPLTSGQARIWFFEQLSPDTSMFNIPIALRLAGPLDRSAFERAVQELLARHSVFRTVIRMRDERPVQVVPPLTTPEPLPLTDLTALAEPGRSVEADRLAAELLRQPFDLSRGPLFRARLIRLSDAEHLFVLPMHHLICDGWSAQVIGRELAALYTANVTGTSANLPPIAVQYVELARQQQAPGDAAVADALRYWAERLAGAPATTEIPADFPRRPDQVAAGASVDRLIGRGLRDRVRQMARQHEVTLFMAMLAVFKCLLLRVTGQDDLIVGVPVTGRPSGAESLVGCFLNHLALRTDASNDPAFAVLLQRVRAGALGAYSHQEVPFERVVEQLHPARDPGRPPFFQIQFTQTFAPCDRLELPGLVIEPRFTQETWSRYDLAVFFAEFDEGIGWRVVYNTQLYTRETVVSLMDRFEHLLAQVAEDPTQPLSAYALLQGNEDEALLGAFGGQLE